MKPNLLHDTSQAGLYHLASARRNDLQRLASRARQSVLAADTSGCRSVSDALIEFGKAFHFPGWYGANLDALHDCLTDPDWQRNRGAVLLISGLESVRHGDPQTFSTLIEVLRSAAESRSAAGNPLWILLTGPVPGIANLPDA